MSTGFKARQRPKSREDALTLLAPIAELSVSPQKSCSHLRFGVRRVLTPYLRHRLDQKDMLRFSWSFQAVALGKHRNKQLAVEAQPRRSIWRFLRQAGVRKACCQ